jgi:hypothetical protein
MDCKLLYYHSEFILWYIDVHLISSIFIYWKISLLKNIVPRTKESVNRSQMDTKRKICDIRTWEKYLFLNISPTNIDTFVPSLYQCVETHSIEIFWLFFQPLPHLRFNLFDISESFATQLRTVLCDKLFQPLFFMNILCIESFFSQKKTHNRTLIFCRILLKHGRHFDYWNQPLNMRMRVCVHAATSST